MILIGEQKGFIAWSQCRSARQAAFVVGGGWTRGCGSPESLGPLFNSFLFPGSSVVERSAVGEAG